MILNYYCFEINGHLSHVRPCMICGESAGLSPGPAHHMPWEAGHSTGQHRPRDHKGDQQTQEQTAPADFFFFLKGNVCYLKSYLKYTSSKSRAHGLASSFSQGIHDLPVGQLTGWVCASVKGQKVPKPWQC